MTDDNKLPLTSSDITAELLAQLREIAPQVFTEGGVDFEKLKATLGENIVSKEERYGLSWAGKSEAFRNVQIPGVGTLLPQPEESVNFDASENLIIEGDNLEVLKLLQKSYHGKVKMIYIDPPYNTGNEFIYPDNYREGLDEYLKYSGQVSDEGIKQTTNTETSGRFHSRWLNMMYPRLFLARNLLRDDGVIFVSIDDYEQHNLRMLMNEVFGEENFVGIFVWKRRTGAMDSTNNVSSDHEYVVCYSRQAVVLNGEKRTFEKYSNPDNDPRGPWIADNLSAAKPGGDTYYPVVNPETKEEYWPPKGRFWPYSRKTMQQKIAEGRIIFPTKPGGTPLLKRFQNEAKSLFMPVSTWMQAPADPLDQEEAAVLRVGNTAEGTKTIKELFGDKEFTYAKPVSLIRALLTQATSPAGNDIVLDFFAGSGTTAHGVLDLNKQDKGNRRFILVQLPEKIENPKFPTITHITRERVRLVINKLVKEEKQASGGYGFKAFRLSSSNFKIWNSDTTSVDPDAIAEQLRLYSDNVQRERGSLDILYEIVLKSGLPITAETEQIEVAGMPVYSIAKGQLLICLENEISQAVLRGMIGLNPIQMVCLDRAFCGDDQLKTNTVLESKSRGVSFKTV